MDRKNPRLWELIKKHKEFILYALFGVATTSVSWVTYGICEAWLHLNLYYCGVFSWIGAVMVAFVTNKLWVFNSKSWKWQVLAKEVVSFFGGRAMTGVLEVTAVPLMVDNGFDIPLFGVEGMTAKIVVTAVVVLLNYIVSKFIVFVPWSILKEEKPPHTEDEQQ